MLFFLCRHLCAPVYSVFLLFVISVLFQNAVTRKTETVRLDHWKQSSPFLPFPKKKKTDKLMNISWYQLWPQWLCDSFTQWEDYLWDVSQFVFVWLRLFVCLFVRSFVCSVFLCRSVPKHKHRHVFLCHLNPVINNLIWWWEVTGGNPSWPVGASLSDSNLKKRLKFRNSNPAEGWRWAKGKCCN